MWGDQRLSYGQNPYENDYDPATVEDADDYDGMKTDRPLMIESTVPIDGLIDKENALYTSFKDQLEELQMFGSQK